MRVCVRVCRTDALSCRVGGGDGARVESNHRRRCGQAKQTARDKGREREGQEHAESVAQDDREHWEHTGQRHSCWTNSRRGFRNNGTSSTCGNLRCTRINVLGASIEY
eukprot:6196195-Pleurochrysis_carterae.AAC.1